MVCVGGISRRITLISDPYGQTIPPNGRQCSRCSGVFGLGQNSVMWEMYSQVRFTAGTITFDSHIDDPEPGMKCKCKDRRDGSLCPIEGEMFGESKTIELAFDSPYIDLPLHLYNRYTQGKKVYYDVISEWESLAIKLYSYDRKDSKVIHMTSGDIHTPLSNGKHLLYIRPGADNDTIRLGTACLHKMVVKKNFVTNEVIIKEEDLKDSIPGYDLVIFSLLFVCLIRWKMTNGILSFDILKHRNNGILHVACEAFAIIAFIVQFISIGARRILEVDFLWLYITTGIISLTAAGLEIWGITKIFYISKTATWAGVKGPKFPDVVQIDYHAPIVVFLINLTRSVSHEIVILNGLWFTVIERRVEGIGTIFTAIIAVLTVYGFTFYIALFGILYSYGENHVGNSRRYRSLRIFLGITLPLIWVYQVAVSYFFFLKPFFDQNAQVYTDLIVGVIVLFIMIIVIIAMSMARFYSRRAVNQLRELRQLSQTRIMDKKAAQTNTSPQVVSQFVGGPVRKTQKGGKEH